MNMDVFPFEPIDDALTDDRVPYAVVFYGAISEIPVEDDDRAGLPGMSDEEYEAFLYNGRSATK